MYIASAQQVHSLISPAFQLHPSHSLMCSRLWCPCLCALSAGGGQTGAGQSLIPPHAFVLPTCSISTNVRDLPTAATWSDGARSRARPVPLLRIATSGCSTRAMWLPPCTAPPTSHPPPSAHPPHPRHLQQPVAAPQASVPTVSPRALHQEVQGTPPESAPAAPTRIPRGQVIPTGQGMTHRARSSSTAVRSVRRQ